MKVVLLITPYSKYIDKIYFNNPYLKTATSFDQTKFISNDGFAWCGVWDEPFRSNGYEVETIYTNATFLQFSWAKENKLDNQISQEEILKKRIEHANPDIIFTDNIYKFNDEWISEIKKNCFSIKYFLGFICSPAYDITKCLQYDIIFTCLRSIEKEMLGVGINARFMPLAFNEQILNRVNYSYSPESTVCFYGGFLRGAKYHGYREKFITNILNKDIQIDLYSDVKDLNETKFILGLKVRKIIYFFISLLEKVKVIKYFLIKVPLYNQIAQWEGLDTRRFDRKLIASLRPSLYGIDLFNTILKYQLVFNAHGDIAGLEAANMRMFEVTGVGRCLLTDWKPNIEFYFKDGEEILTYKTEEECISKIKWVLDHPEEAALIAKAGQERTLKCHTYKTRVKEIFKAIEVLKSKRTNNQNNTEIFS
jgi:spore maturation protein CgeB